jgi:archaellum component FlaC
MSASDVDINEVMKDPERFNLYMALTIKRIDESMARGEKRMERIEGDLSDVKDDVADVKKTVASIHTGGCAKQPEHDAVKKRVEKLENEGVIGKALMTIASALAGFFGGGLNSGG